MNAPKETVDVLNVLIVDDHRMVRDGISMMLGSLKKFYQFNITEAESGDEALRKLNRKDFDIVIIDYQMPGMSGVETVQSILRHKPATKILALSNYDEFAYVESMLTAGA